MSDAPPAKKQPRSRRIYVLWGVALVVAGVGAVVAVTTGACNRDAGTKVNLETTPFRIITELEKISFRIVTEPDQIPLSNRELLVFDGSPEDVRYEHSKTKAAKQKHYLTSVTTDAQGAFTLDLSDVGLIEVVIQPGPPYRIVGFERASDLCHTRSPYHVRVCRLVPGKTRTLRNDLYDLRTRVVRQVGLDNSETQGSYREILLVTRKKALQ